MISIIYAKVGSDSFTQVVQYEFDDVKIPIEKEIVNHETGEVEKVVSKEFVKSEVYEAPSWWREPEKINIPSDCVIMSGVRPDTNYIVKNNGNGTGEWIKDNSVRISENQVLKDKMLTEAVNQISLLQDAIDLDMSEDGDEDELKAWKKYRVLLSRVDTSVENMELPEKPY